MKRIIFYGFYYKDYIYKILLYVFLIIPFYSVQADSVLSVKINNPLGDSITTIPSFIESAINIVLMIGIPIVALAIIYSGFLFVVAQGNSEKLSEAKKTLMYTLIGAALLLGSWVIAQAIQGTVSDIKSTS
ncbi:MAG: hypothetical protein NTX85_03635 [Candidatus Nomurabacteria bacterium]|nr:hypothetical protein [Candidatus Nomurabacteria bacterium]